MSKCCKNQNEEAVKLENDKHIYPVEQVSADEKPTEKNVEDAVDELNPNADSMDKRG